MKKLKTINEFVVQQGIDYDLLVEMSRINDKKTFKYDVFVNGGNSYGTGRNEHGDPHFHFSDNIKYPQNFNLSILIPTITEWKQNRELYIIESMNDYFNWNELKKEKKELIDWLDQPNIYIKSITNLEYIISQWNSLNADNKNVKLIGM